MYYLHVGIAYANCPELTASSFMTIVEITHIDRIWALELAVRAVIGAGCPHAGYSLSQCGGARSPSLRFS